MPKKYCRELKCRIESTLKEIDVEMMFSLDIQSK